MMISLLRTSGVWCYVGEKNTAAHCKNPQLDAVLYGTHHFAGMDVLGFEIRYCKFFQTEVGPHTVVVVVKS